jgi:integrase
MSGVIFHNFFLPHVLAKKKRSTHKFYQDIFNNHLRAAVGDIRLEDFQTVHAQRVLHGISLSLATLRRIKTTMSALFSHAARIGFVAGANPVHQAKPEGEMNDVEQYAYDSAEVLDMLTKLPEPARTIVATAAFTGLRKSELRGLQWQDYDGTYLHVQRSVWRTHVGKPKPLFPRPRFR